jgi:CheY-like chemotaxis protein
MARILVVDDDPSIRALLTELLQDEGYAVQATSDGQQALAAVRLTPPDLILLDLTMPVLNGLGVLRALRADAVLARVPVVVLTAGALPARAMLGVQRVLAKPFDLHALLALVAQYARPRLTR